KGVKETIQASHAKLIFVPGHAYKTDGETGPTKLSEYIRELQEYLPRKIDAVLYNNAILNEIQQKNYLEKKWGVIEVDAEKVDGYRIIGGDYEHVDGGLDPVKLGQMLKQCIDELL
ncbi:MAG TPA: hypothetical protein VEA18_00525, partial [Candidatus Kapabacteria bacterium]|nr:hypothetical protein [Candidatus Kapabacteria bacterium]